MYEDCQTQVMTREGNTEYFNVKVGLHQGSAISLLLFIISEIDTEPPWAMLFADDLVLCETSKAAVERELEIWRDQFERHVLRVSRTKTVYIQGSTLTFKSTCPIGQQAWESYLPPFLTSCPIHGAAADSENMEGGSICNVVMGIGMYISYQPVALIVFVTSWPQKSQNNRTGTVFIIVHNQILSDTVIRDNMAEHFSNQVYLVKRIGYWYISLQVV